MTLLVFAPHPYSPSQPPYFLLPFLAPYPPFSNFYAGGERDLLEPSAVGILERL